MRVRGVWAVGIGFDVGSFFAHGRRRGFIHGVEEVPGLQEDPGVLYEWMREGALPKGCGVGALLGLGRHGPPLLLLWECIMLAMSEWGSNDPGKNCRLAGECSSSSGPGE